MSATLSMGLDNGWYLEVATEDYARTLLTKSDPYEELDEVYRQAKLQLDNHFRGTEPA